ncbi:MAG: hypothetical protein RMK89_05775, partial [Armatimonadota bacterium]|nr:hypothetical protein [Armatimonadota bacterium]MDW8142957.1 hypothetical protein [Armatimonadota bacterium]
MRRLKSLILAGLVMGTMASLRAQGLKLRGEIASFRFDSLGNIVATAVRGKSIALQPSPLPFSLRVDGKWWHDDLPKVEPVKAQRLRNQVDVTAKVGDFVITTHYRLLKGFILQKSVTVRYEGEGEPKVDGALFLLPYVVTDV